MPDPRPAGGGFERQAQDTKEQRSRLRRVEQPSGTMLSRLLETVTNRLAQIPGEVQAAISSISMTKDDIQAALATKSDTAHKHAAADITSGTLTLPVSTTTVTASGALQGNSLRATTAPGTNITGTRVAAWLQSSDGLLGTASSSERFKTNIRPASLDPASVLKLQVVYYQYIAELEQREHDPTYRVATEIGVIAERLHEAGLWQFVIYERDADGAVLTDATGNPVCFGVRYELMALALIPVAQAQAKQIETLSTDVATLKSQLLSVNTKLLKLGIK